METSAQLFAKSMPGQERSIVRQALAKAKLTNNRKAVLKSMIDLWFANRHRSEIHPGAEKLAKKAGVSERTVRSYLGEFRQAGWIVALAYEKGGRKATRYAVKLWEIIKALMPSNVVTRAGELVEIANENTCSRRPENPAKIADGKERPASFIKGWGDLSRLTLGFQALWRGAGRVYRLSQEDLRPRRVAHRAYLANISPGEVPF